MEIGLSSIRLQRRLGVEAETMDYLIWNASFDTTIAQDLLADSEIKCADFLASIPVMTAFYEENKRNPYFYVIIG